MKKSFTATTYRGLLLSLFVLGLVAALIILPSQFRSKAGGNEKSKNAEILQEKFEDYDIRNQKSTEVSDILMSFRQTAGRNASDIADIRDGFINGENALRRTVPTLKIEYNKELRNPEVIGPDVLLGRGVLTQRSSQKHADVLRGFSKQYKELIGLTGAQIDNLKVTADYKNPSDNLSFARLEQFVDDIPVFRAEIRAGFTKQGEMFRAVNNLAPGLEYANLSKNFGSAADAVVTAAGYINYKMTDADLIRNEKASTDLKVVFGEGDFATTAEKMYFPTEAGVARAAWRVLNWQLGNAYYVIVDAETGTMLYREDITKDQTQQATYNVYANTNSILRVMGNPAPLNPNPISPALGTQGTLMPRTDVTTIGNEGVYSFNNLGWITDGGNVTDGNNVEAGVDRNLPNGVDATVTGTNRVFNFAYTPGAGANNGPGDDPLLVPYQNGASTNLFYVTNRYHDETYLLGFTEQAKNFQNDNFGRGGLGADRVSAQAQDNTVGSSCAAQPCVNNANFSTPADGGRGVMQMYLWNRMNPWRDGDLDAEIIVHELTHGLFGRLHNGVGGTQAGQMNEGNSDFFAHTLLGLDTDPINGVYVTGGYATYLLRGTTFTGNYYYGIRRFPKAVLAFTGGPLNRPHNPLTYADIDPSQMNLTDGAFSPAFTGSATAVHDGGEIWSSMLWEVRAKMVARLGNVAGSKRVLQTVMNGMKIAPSNPTMLQERNAIVAAAQAGGVAADLSDVWAGFALRGLGYSASNPTGNTVVQAFNTPTLTQTGTLVVSDAPGDNDGYPEPGETIALNVPLTNFADTAATGVTVQIVGGGTTNYGTINSGATVTQAVTYTVPGNTGCGTEISLTVNVNSNFGAFSFNYLVIVGVPTPTFTENFDSATAPAFPAGWTTAVVQSGVNFVTTVTNPDTAPNSAFALNPATVGGGTNLTSPSTAITATAATVSFRNRFDTEAGWDGGVLEISINGGAFADIITAGGRFVQNGYAGALGAGTNNPLANRPAWSGNSSGYVTSIVRLPAAAAGQSIQLRWRFGADDNTAGTGTPSGWNVDTIKVNGTYGCSLAPATAKARIDFDGDNKTDISIFRPSNGQWWYLKSSDGGNAAFQFGNSSDKMAPADFTGDGKTDVAFFRPSTGEWFILRSEDNSFYSFPFGTSGDIPAPADFDEDGKADAAVFRPSNGTWYINKSGGGTTIEAFGLSSDIPVVADYDSDGKADIAIYRPSTGEWWLNRSNDGIIAYQFGNSTDKPVQGDYTGDGKVDVAVWRPSTGEWFILRSEDASFYSFPFGVSTDKPTPGDYDGDGRSDAAVFRPSDSTWYVQRTTAGTLIQGFGTTGDAAVPAAFTP
ncbi:MAG: M36 family metallopeptidase [Pyrinomonadaceae bacterium]